MAQPINKPKFPVIDSDPSFGKVMSAWRFSEWRMFGLATLISLPFGYAAGRPIVMRQSMMMAGTLGAMFGGIYGLQSSFARLSGYKENAVEVAKFGTSETTEAAA